MEPNTLTTHIPLRTQARGIVERVQDEHLELRIPHTDYRLRLRLAGGAPPTPGQRVAGTLEAKALRIHRARGGGRFIEPAWGEPRIVAGTVLAVDAEGRRVLVDVAVPMWLVAEAGQDFDVIEPGGLVNCYVESGATFTPAPPA